MSPPRHLFIWTVLLLCAVWASCAGTKGGPGHDSALVADSQAQEGSPDRGRLDGAPKDVKAPGTDGADSLLPKPDTAKPPTPLKNVTMLVNLGDSLAAGYYAGKGRSYKALLVKNNDLLYPAYKGKDLNSWFPGIKVVDRSKSGAVTKDVISQAKGVSGNPKGLTLVLISAGGNDFNDNILTMINPVQASAMAKQGAANLGQVVARFSNKLLFPGGAVILLLKVHDPTDGTGTVPAKKGLQGFCSVIQKLGIFVGPTAIKNLALFNQQLAGSVGKASNVTVVDNQAAFLGHGFHHDDPKNKYYQAKDPTLWFHNDCTHGNDRGHHELRRLFWSKISGTP